MTTATSTNERLACELAAIRSQMAELAARLDAAARLVTTPPPTQTTHETGAESPRDVLTRLRGIARYDIDTNGDDYPAANGRWVEYDDVVDLLRLAEKSLAECERDAASREDRHTEESAMGDVYDRCVELCAEQLKNDPMAIYRAWNYPWKEPGGALFTFVSPSRMQGKRPDGKYCGCLTQIRGQGFVAYNDELTERIRKDERIPRFGLDITVEHLPAFAEWQREIDRVLGRTPPQLDENGIMVKRSSD